MEGMDGVCTVTSKQGIYIQQVKYKRKARTRKRARIDIIHAYPNTADDVINGQFCQ